MAEAPLRSEIEQALDELESYEEGMRFQHLAVALAKQRWPELVAAERKNDLGLDAFVTRSQAINGFGRGLACSITAEYSKLASDAEKIVKNFGDEVKYLVFATSGKVSTPKKLEWTDKIRDKFGLELEVLSREDIVSSLSEPKNAGLCRTYLRLEIESLPTTAAVIKKIREAAREENGNWARRIAGLPLIELRANGVDKNGEDDDELWSLADIEAALRDARRLVVQSAAGRGKTTLLIMLAEGQLSTEGTAILVDLPSWVESGEQVLPFVAGFPAFQARGLGPELLAQAQAEERFYFLLNGWNEVAEQYSTRAVNLVRGLERQFPTSGIILTTRAHHVAPPLTVPGATTLRLRPIGREARSRYVRERLKERATEVLNSLASDRSLDELTRTPFVLSEVAAIVLGGEPIPRTRVGVMEAAIRVLERSPEHQVHLTTSAVAGFSQRYLEALGMEMSRKAAVSLSAAEGNALIREVSAMLVDEGQLSARPHPPDILNTICAHHLLERIDYPEVAYRFQHQLFQEYYASLALARQFHASGPETSVSFSAARSEFLRTYINEPAWAEPLLMFAEALRIRSANTRYDAQDSGPLSLVDLALTVDPVFAGQLTRALGANSGDPIGRKLNEKLRNWYRSTNASYQNCALAAMLASGLDAFRDVLEPMLASIDQQIRLAAYHLSQDFSPSCLGPRWSEIVRTWPDDARAEFVSQVLSERVDPEVYEFAHTDRSVVVRQSAFHALERLGADEELIRLASTFRDDEFAVVLHGLPTEFVPKALHTRAAAALRELVLQESNPVQRLREF